MGHDQLFKSILRSLFRNFLELFFPDYAARLDFDAVQFSDKELFKGFPDGRRREPDVVAQVRTLEGDQETVVVHIEVEVEAEAKDDFRRRMFEYYALLWLAFEAPVFPIALHLKRGPREGITTDEYRQELFGREVMRFRYASVALARLTGREYVEKGPLAAALAALMRRSRDPQELELHAQMLRRVLTSGLDEALQFLLVNVIETYFPVSESERERYVRLLSRKEYKVVQDVELTWADRLELKGVERGKRETLKRLLTARFGPLPADVDARIDAVGSAEELDRCLDRVLTASSLEEMGLKG